MKRLAIAAMFLLSSPFAYAADEKPASNDPTSTAKLTVQQVINIADALRQLGDYRDKDNKTVKVPFEFDGGTRMTFAIDINHADAAQQVYTLTRTDLINKMVGDRLQRLAKLQADPKKKAEADALQAELNGIQQDFNQQDVRMLTTPAGALLSRIKESELCMAAPPVKPCRVTNAIPPSLLAALVPIIDR
jgi:hypothetical protein